MCRCCQNCWEDLYWSCIEEKFCYDETIAHYNAEEDEYYNKKKPNGCLVPPVENNNGAICVQPTNNYNRNCSLSSKIHEDDYYREIQTNIPILAPEILSVFANSQIFHEHQPQGMKSKIGTPLINVHKSIIKQNESEKLLGILEKEGSKSPIPNEVRISIDTCDSRSSSSTINSRPQSTIKEEIEEGEAEEEEKRGKQQKENNLGDEVQERKTESHENLPKSHLAPKSYFDFRPASENDIFTITKHYGQISMTPEIPSISISNLPKSYIDTPKIEEYRESVSLYSIQCANSARLIENEQHSMPRYFGKSDMILNSPKRSASNVEVHHHKRVEKSKRLGYLRTTLPPLTINTDKLKLPVSPNQKRS